MYCYVLKLLSLITQCSGIYQIKLRCPSIKKFLRKVSLRNTKMVSKGSKAEKKIPYPLEYLSGNLPLLKQFNLTCVLHIRVSKVLAHHQTLLT